MEAASLALGILPVAIVAVESYHKGMKSIGDYRNYPQTLQGIRRNLFIQDQQLQVTLESIGLRKPSIQDVQQRLREINPEYLDQFVDILEHMGRVTAGLINKLDIDSNGKPRWTDEIPERASWEWRRVRRNFGDRYRRELFDELQYWNNALRNCLELKREIPSDHADPLTAELLRHFDLKSCDEARKNIQIVHEILAAAWDRNCTDPHHPGNVELIWQQKGLKETGQLQLSVPELGRNGESQHWQKVLISVGTKRLNSMSNSNVAPKLPSTTTPAKERTSTLPKKRKWQALSEISGISGIKKLFSFKSNLRASLVVPRLPVASIQMDHLGSDHNGPSNTQLITALCSLMKQKEWKGHLLHTETGSEKIIHMEKIISPCPRFANMPLESVISDHYFRSSRSTQIACPRLSRKERLGIAAAAVWAVLLLCGTSWLEERWLGKEDITLLVDVPMQCGGFDRPRTYPTLSHTFTSQNETSTTSLRSRQLDHFQACQIRHKTSFALGVLLIELGLNKTFDQIRTTGRNTEEPTVDISAQEYYRIANQVIDSQELELDLGESYANAVQRCIQCHFLGRESTQNFLHSGFRKQFFAGVVAPVQATFDAQITSVHSL